MPRSNLIAIDAPIRSQPSITKAKRVLKLALEYAILAPSSHNTQPWLFRIKDNTVELYADRARSLKVIDPGDRALVMSCGAALYQLRLALRSFGYGEKAELLPNPNNQDLLAVVTLTGIQPPQDEDLKLFDMISSRHTHRGRFEPQPLSEMSVTALQDAATAEKARLYLTQDLELRQTIAQLIAEGDRLQWQDPLFRSELSAWTTSNHSKRQDGIPGYALGMNDVASVVSPLMIRTFDMGDGQAAKDQELAEGSPALAVLYTEADTPYYWLNAGQALARVLLKARLENLHASFLNQTIEVGALRSQLREALGISGMPQLLLRLGYGDEARATPRRPIEEVIRDKLE